MQNDTYRLKVLVPLLELLHHHTVNQDNIQETAALLAEMFAPFLLRPYKRIATHSQQSNFAVAAVTTMILDYRSLFSQTGLDNDSCTSNHMLAPNGIDIPMQRSSSTIPVTRPVAIPRSAPPSLHYVSSEPEDFCQGIKSSSLTVAVLGNSPKAYDLDSAFSGGSSFSMCSSEAEDLRQTSEAEYVDEDLVTAVNNLFTASTAGLLLPV